jgi:NAD(P)-dependent dehydrogenase (short-subunit alcohol dehydrogenase family)
MGVATVAAQDSAVGPSLPLGDKPVLTPQEIADAAVFLASDAARGVSGVSLDIALGFNAAYTA